MAADLSKANSESSATGAGPRVPIARAESRADARKVALQRWQERHRKTLVSGEKRSSFSRPPAVLHGKENDVRRVRDGIRQNVNPRRGQGPSMVPLPQAL